MKDEITLQQIGPHQEEWRDIEGFEGLYQVSNYGRVKRLPKRIIRSNGIPQTFDEKILACPHDKDGYVQISLSHLGKTVKRKMHRLVATAFISNIPENKQINHKNLIKDDNTSWNLEIVTQSENVIHSYKNDKNRKPTYLNLQKPVIAYYIYRKTQKQKITILGEFSRFKSISEASKSTGIISSSISSCLKNKQKTAGGYKWRYADE